MLAIVRDVALTGFGDTILFRLAETLNHRVTDVETGPSRTVFTGWFLRRPTLSAWG